MVTKAALTEMCDKLFNEIDTNENGKLEKEEVRQFTEQTQKLIDPNAKLDAAEFEEQFKIMDVNGDGIIAKEELFKSLYEKAKSCGQLAEGE